MRMEALPRLGLDFLVMHMPSPAPAASLVIHTHRILYASLFLISSALIKPDWRRRPEKTPPHTQTPPSSARV